MSKPTCEPQRKSPLLNQLMLNAEKNVQILPNQRQHNELLKKFATSLLTFTGPYEFVQQNMSEALPSLRTVQRIVRTTCQPFDEGEFCFDELAVHFKSYNAPMVVTFGEDVTHLVKRDNYDWLGLCYRVIQRGCQCISLKKCRKHFEMQWLPIILLCTWPNLFLMVYLLFAWHALVQTTNFC